MSKLWLVALYEYKRHVFKKSFILAILSVPLIIALVIGAGWLSDILTSDNTAVGYVDHAGLLADPIPAPKPGSSPDEHSVPDPVPLIAYPTEAVAREALELGEIQAYYVIAPDYSETNRVELVYTEPPDGDVTRQFWDFMQINRLTDLPLDIAQRAVADSNLIVRWPDDSPGGGREFSQRAFLNQFLPLFAGMAFIALLFMSSGFLMGMVVEEKENRTMEVLVTSLSPTQLIGGKIVGVVAISFTQLIAWIVLAGLTLLIGGRYLDISLIQNLSLDLRILAPMVALFFPAYVMYASLMMAMGVTVAETQEAQQMTAIFIIPTMLPLWLIKPIIEHPNGPLAVGLSLFPVTALPTFSLRLAFSQVPLWQVAASVVILALSALGALWLAARAFRLGMLRYGQRLNWRELFQRAR
jgi:ABC-2 type transport system permease protein